MKPVLISVFLLSFLLSIDADLLCYQCHARNSETCKEQVIVKCPKGEQCMIISEAFTYNGIHHSIWKGCSRNIPCNMSPKSRVNSAVYLIYNMKCCGEDLCNKQSFEMPPKEPFNGHVCSSCIEEDTLGECKAKKEIMCRGDEDKCLNHAGIAKSTDGTIFTYSLQGCTSSLFCRFRLDRLVGLQVLYVSFFCCTTPLTGEGKDKLDLVPQKK